MVQRGDGSRFPLEALGELLLRSLDGYDAIETRVASFVHFPHSARADRREDLVRPELGSWGHLSGPDLNIAGQFTRTVRACGGGGCGVALTRNRWPSGAA